MYTFLNFKADAVNILELPALTLFLKNCESIASRRVIVVMVAPDSLMEPPKERSSSKDPTRLLTNGNDTLETTNQESAEVQKPPSYVALACCISGYTTLIYDKTRQDLRSRTASPIRVDGLQDPAYSRDHSNFLTTAPTNRSIDRMQTQGKSNSYGLDFLNGCGGLHSPRHVANMTVTKENINYKSVVSESCPSYTPSSSHYSYSSSLSTPSPAINGSTAHGSKLIAPTNVAQHMSPSSFIVQRVERLYGPGALAQGFYARKNTTSSKVSKAHESSSTSSQTLIEKNDDEGLPVLKLLRPEFRAQLTVSSRKGRMSLPEKPSSPEELKEIANIRMTDNVDASIQKPSEIHEEETKNGHYFLKLHASQVNTLEALAEMAENELHGCDNEEAQGILRAAAGKARLLVAQKLNQFKGLCEKNIEQSSTDDFPTTNEDLAGFWDMVMIQVDDVVSQCSKIKRLKKNAWKLEDETTEDLKRSSTRVCPTKKITPKKVDPKAKNASQARDEARRKMIEERRKAMKQRQGENNNDVIVV